MNSFPKRVEISGDVIGAEFDNGQELLHTTEFSKLITKKNREAFLSVVKEAKTITRRDGSFNIKTGAVEQDGIEVKWYKRYKRDYKDPKPQHFYKISLNEVDYFVKETPNELVEEYGGGPAEIKAMAKAKEMLAEVPNVEVVDYQLAYGDSKSTFFISKWNNVLETTLQEYAQSLPYNDALVSSLQLGVMQIRVVLEKYFTDVNNWNMSYDKARNTIIIFDLKPRKSIYELN